MAIIDLGSGEVAKDENAAATVGRIIDLDTGEFVDPQQAAPVIDEPAQQDPGFSIAETISNIPGSALQLGKDIIEPILSPIETAKSLQSLGQGLVEKAFVPSVIDGVDFGQTQNEEVVDAVGNFINERYGSLDAFKSTVQNDPVGVLSDIAGLFTGGSTLLPKTGKLGKIASAVEAVGKAADPLNIATTAVKTLAKSGKAIPQALPEKLLQSALKFKPSISQKQRTNMTKTALKEGIMPTVAGLEKVAERLSTLNTKMDAIIDGATSRGTMIPVGAVFSELRKVRKELGGVKVDAVIDLRIVNKVAKSLGEQLKTLGKKKITPRELQDLKTNAYQKINFDIKQGQAGFAKNEARSAIARGAKGALEGIDPNIQAINRASGDLLELSGELDSVVNRLDNRNLISLDTAAKIAAGAGLGTAVGSPILGSVVGVTAAVAGNPRVKAKTAIILENIRKNADTVELINNKLPPVLARSLATQAGRINESLNSQLGEENVE